MKQTMTVQEASLVLGMSEQAIREALKNKRLDIGVAYKSVSTGKNFRYLISRAKVEKLLKGEN